MTTPIYDQVTKAFEDVKATAYKRGYLTAQLDILKVISNINPSMTEPERLLLDIINRIEKMTNLQPEDEPSPPKPRTRKKQSK